MQLAGQPGGAGADPRLVDRRGAGDHQPGLVGQLGQFDGHVPRPDLQIHPAAGAGIDPCQQVLRLALAVQVDPLHHLIRERDVGWFRYMHQLELGLVSLCKNPASIGHAAGHRGQIDRSEHLLHVRLDLAPGTSTGRNLSPARPDKFRDGP